MNDLILPLALGILLFLALYTLAQKTYHAVRFQRWLRNFAKDHKDTKK